MLFFKNLMRFLIGHIPIDFQLNYLEKKENSRIIYLKLNEILNLVYVKTILNLYLYELLCLFIILYLVWDS
jgi:hypothetical protein